MKLPPLEPLNDFDTITGPNPTAWQKVANLILHVIELEKTAAELEKRAK